MKQRIYANKRIKDIRHAFRTSRSDMRHIINRIGNENRIAEPIDNEFYEYFKDLSSQQESDYFRMTCSRMRQLNSWRTKYDSDCDMGAQAESGGICIRNH